MTKNNAAKAAEQAIKAAIRKAYDDGYNDAKMAPDNCSTYCVERAVRLDSAALQSALRAPVADEDDQPTAPDDDAIAECWVTASDCDGIAYDGPSFERGYRMGEIAERDRAALASAPVAGEAQQADDTLKQVYDWFGIGVMARNQSTLMACLGNVIRRANCLSQIERVLSVPTPPEPEDDGVWGEESLLRWGADEKGYAEHFKAALAEWSRRTPMSEEPVYAYRRKGLDDFVTCNRQRFDELSAKPRLFETRIFYAAPQASEAVRDASDMDDLRSRVMAAIHDCADLKPEDDEGWDEWYCAAFDLLGTRVGDIFRAALSAQPSGNPGELGAQRATVRNPLTVQSSGNSGELSAQPGAQRTGGSDAG